MAQATPIKRTTKLWITAATLLFIGALLWAFISNLPKGYSADLSRIGQGGNVVVLVYDNQRAASGELMGLINQIRDAWQDRVAFIVADVNTPEGAQYVSAQDYPPGTLIFYAPDGRILMTAYQKYTLDSLKAQLNQVYHAP